EEMPSRRSAGAFVALQVVCLLCGRKRGRLTRIEADGDDLEIAAWFERQHGERTGQAVEHLRAEHRAVVVHEREDDRSSAEIIGEVYGSAVRVDKRQVQRNRLVQSLIESDLAERLRNG